MKWLYCPLCGNGISDEANPVEIKYACPKCHHPFNAKEWQRIDEQKKEAQRLELERQKTREIQRQEEKEREERLKREKEIAIYERQLAVQKEKDEEYERNLDWWRYRSSDFYDG